MATRSTGSTSDGSRVLRLSGEEFRSRFSLHVSNANSLVEVELGVISLLRDLKSSGASRIGFTCGMITSEGFENIPKNMIRHAKYTNLLREEMKFPVFSASDVFHDEKMFARVIHTPQEHWFALWRNMLRDESVTHLFFTPNWELSAGAIDEHKIGRELRLSIHYVQSELDEPLSIRPLLHH